MLNRDINIVTTLTNLKEMSVVDSNDGFSVVNNSIKKESRGFRYILKNKFLLLHDKNNENNDMEQGNDNENCMASGS